MGKGNCLKKKTLNLVKINPAKFHSRPQATSQHAASNDTAITTPINPVYNSPVTPEIFTTNLSNFKEECWEDELNEEFARGYYFAQVHLFIFSSVYNNLLSLGQSTTVFEGGMTTFPQQIYLSGRLRDFYWWLLWTLQGMWCLPLSWLYCHPVPVWKLSHLDTCFPPPPCCWSKFTFTMFTIPPGSNMFMPVGMDQFLFQTKFSPSSQLLPPTWAPPCGLVYEPSMQHLAIYSHSYQWDPSCGSVILCLYKSCSPWVLSSTTPTMQVIPCGNTWPPDCVHIFTTQTFTTPFPSIETLPLWLLLVCRTADWHNGYCWC